MIDNNTKWDGSEEKESFASSSTQHNQLLGDTKLQRIVKTLFIDLSFVAVVSKI